MIILFEDEIHKNLYPLNELRHCSELLIGTTSILGAFRKETDEEIAAWGRKYLEVAFKERTGVSYNERAEGTNILVNSLTQPKKSTVERILKLEKGEAILDNGRLVATCIDTSSLEPGVIKERKEKEIISSCKKEEASGTLLKYYWDFVRENGEMIKEQFKYFGQKYKGKGTVKGSTDLVHIATSTVDDDVVFDTRTGPIIIEEDAEIEAFSLISGPCYIARKTKVFSTLIRHGTSAFFNCRLGGEVENSIMYPFSNKPHHGYIGDAIVGEWVNLGAGSTFSNLKNTYGNARVTLQKKRIDTGMLKLGPLISDMVKVSINSSVYGGRIVGISSFISGTVEANVGDFLIYRNGKTEKLKLDKVIQVQERMMARRGQNLSKNQRDIIEYVYKRRAGKN